MTLAFFGDVPEENLADLKERLGRAAARNTPMELALAGGGRFGGRTLWTGVQRERERLGRLAESVNSVARRCHVKVDERPFRPHLTLARVGEDEERLQRLDLSDTLGGTLGGGVGRHLGGRSNEHGGGPLRTFSLTSTDGFVPHAALAGR